MTYALVALAVYNIATLVIAIVALRAERRAAGLREDRLQALLGDQQEAARLREDQLLNRIQAPSTAVAQSAVENAQRAGGYEPASIGAYDDDAAARYEQERNRLELETRQLIESIEAPS